MQAFDIYNCKTTWRNCTDTRPWLIVETARADTVGCFPISGECYDGNCFWISKDHPDFSHTGLSKSCYIHDSHIVEIDRANVLRRRGCLQGSLLAEFREFSGV
jgi:hypothetical protein